MDPRVLLGHMECVVVDDGKERKEGEEVAFLYHLANGSSPRSYGINVARLAQLPVEVIELATQQSAAFEDKLNSAKAAGGVSGGAEGADGKAVVGIEGTSRDVMYRFFDRLVSIACSEMTQPELVAAARDLYTRYKDLAN